MKKRDLLIAIAVIAFGIIYNAIRSGDINVKFGSIYDKPWELLDRSYPRDFPQDPISFLRMDKIEIRCPAGDIEVVRGADNGNEENLSRVQIQPAIRIYHKSRPKAEAIRQRMKIVVVEKTEHPEPAKDADQEPAVRQQSQKQVRIEVKPEDDFPLRRARVNFKVVIPEAVELTLRTRYGDIAINGCGNKISLENKQGDISVKHVAGDLEINHRSGRVTLAQVEGKVDLSANYSRIRINNVSALKLNCSKSSAAISGVEHDTRIEYGAYSSIAMEECGGLFFEGRQTKLKLKRINHRIRIKNAHQPIYMSEINGDVFIDGRNCRIDMDKVTAGEVVVKNAYNYAALDKISARNLDLLLRNGDLDLAFDRITGKINIKNRHSKVTLIVPAGVQPLYNIQARYGSVINRTSDRLTLIKERGRVLANSNALEGSPEIAISTTYGDILLDDRTRERH
jgi:DUF4097 and DUF4098 domain-containing protein YvlB